MENVSENGEMRARVEDREPNYMGAGGGDRVFVGEKKMKDTKHLKICVVSSSKPKWYGGLDLGTWGHLSWFRNCENMKSNSLGVWFQFWKNKRVRKQRFEYVIVIIPF